MLVAAASVALAATAILAVWNWIVASRVHEWTTDPKNTYLFITKRLTSGALRRDFPFDDERIFKFYQPMYMGVAVRLSRWFGSIIPATRVLHFAFTFIYLFGWVALGSRLGGSRLGLALFLAALVPYVPVTSADGISVGAPGTWWSRSMANAFVPWFALLAHTYWSQNGTIVWACVLTGVLLHIHPVVAVGLLPALVALPAVAYVLDGSTPGASLLIGLTALGTLGALFVRSYFRAASRPREVNVDWDRVNRLAFERFRLWPYQIVPERWRGSSGLDRRLHIGVGCAYLLSVGIVLLAPDQPPAVRYYWLTILNFAIVAFLHFPPGEGSGVRLSVLAGLGAAHVIVMNPWFIALPLAALVLSRIRLRRTLLCGALLLTFGLLVWGRFDRTFWSAASSRAVSPFEWWLAITIPSVFFWYLGGSIVTMDVLPLRMHQPLKIIDWGRTAKIVQLPMYCYVLWLAIDIAGFVGAAEGSRAGGIALIGLYLGAVLLNPLTAYRRPLDPRDKALFDWARQTDADTLFHVASDDIWFGFDFRVNTLRAITGSWKDGGICHYSNVDRFFEWDARMRMMADGLASGSLSTLAEHGRRLGADFVVVDRRLQPTDDSKNPTAFANERWLVRSLAGRPVAIGEPVAAST